MSIKTMKPMRVTAPRPSPRPRGPNRYHNNQCPKCSTPLDRDTAFDPDKHDDAKTCPGCQEKFIKKGAAVAARVKEARAIREELAAAKKLDPRACYYLACPTCHQYVPERHEATLAWLAAHSIPDTDMKCPKSSWTPYYRLVDPEGVHGAAVLGLGPMESLAWVGRK